MTNSKQRNKNRETARRLAEGTFYCPECGKAEAHWIGPSLFYPEGFWTCPKFYDKNGVRKT